MRVVFYVIALLVLFVPSSFGITIIDSTDEEQLNLNHHDLFQWLKGGNIDLMSNGLIRSSAKVFQMNLGNPERFNIPLYLIVGATSEVIQDLNFINDVGFADLVNNDGGFVNFGTHFNRQILNINNSASLGIHILLGAKSISGLSLEDQERIDFLSKSLNVGLEYKTLAWMSSNPDNKGEAWVNIFITLSDNPDDEMRAMFGNYSESKLYALNLEGGLNLREYVDFRFGYYQYLNNNSIEIFNEHIFKFTADFIIKN